MSAFWQELGLCHAKIGATDDERRRLSRIFFGNANSAEPFDSGPAKAICARCPVRIPCLEQAMAKHERYGIWGGLTRNQRDALSQLRREVPGASGVVLPCQCCNTITVVVSGGWPYCSLQCGSAGPSTAHSSRSTTLRA